jgi:hypothetical protein
MCTYFQLLRVLEVLSLEVSFFISSVSKFRYFSYFILFFYYILILFLQLFRFDFFVPI